MSGKVQRVEIYFCAHYWKTADGKRAFRVMSFGFISKARLTEDEHNTNTDRVNELE